MSFSPVKDEPAVDVTSSFPYIHECMQARPGQKKIQAAETRAQLLSAGIRVFAERGYHAARLEDIAAAAGTTRGAVYWHFADKEDLLIALLERIVQRWNKGAVDRTQPPSDAIKWLGLELAGNVADDAAETGLELAQRAVGALELAGVGIALVHDERELADPLVGLAQLDAEPIGEFDELLARPVHQLGIGREGNVLWLHRGVDDDAVEIGWLDGAGAGRDRQALLQQGLEALLAHAVAPAGDRGALERQGVPEEFLAAEILIIRVLDPPCAHHFVAEIEDRRCA